MEETYRYSQAGGGKIPGRHASVKPGGLNGWHVIKIHFLPILRKHNLVCTCRVLCTAKFPQLSGDARIPTHASLVICFCFGREKMQFLFMTIKASAIYDIWSSLHYLISFYLRYMWPAILDVLFHAASWLGEIIVITNLSHYAILFKMNLWYTMYAITKHKVNGFLKVNIFMH